VFVGGLLSSFYSPPRSVPVRIMYGNTVNCLREAWGLLPTKTKRDGMPSRLGRTWGSANPWMPPLAPPFIHDTARWVPKLVHGGWR
jgi:hypothetical protein